LTTEAAWAPLPAAISCDLPRGQVTTTRFPQGIKFMWKSRRYAAMAIAGAGFAMAAATPASACFTWGHSGIYSYGWGYANTGYSDYPAYSYRSCGGTYHIQGWGECGGYGPCGWAPFPPLVVTVPCTDSAAPVERVTRASRGRADRMRAQSVGR
jgi:hypothetical protein